jgi:type IV fimbrial biogenesis protein FimT
MIEVLITVVIISILAVIAIPSFQALLSSNRAATQVNEFVTDLNMARSEAIKRGQRITVCKSPDGGNCTSAGNWDQGWVVFIDVNNDATIADEDDIIRVRAGIGGATLVGSAEVQDFVSFVQTGASRLLNGRTQSGTITLNGSGQEFLILINTAGRVRTEKN